MPVHGRILGHPIWLTGLRSHLGQRLRAHLGQRMWSTGFVVAFWSTGFAVAFWVNGLRAYLGQRLVHEFHIRYGGFLLLNV